MQSLKCLCWHLASLLLSQSIFVCYHALHDKLPESSSELKSEENKMRERYSIRKQKSTTPKITPHCSTHLAKKKKKMLLYTVPLAQFIQILKNYTVSVLNSVFINSKDLMLICLTEKHE